MRSTPELAVSPSWGRRLVGIEGLRGLAAFTVLVGHVQIHLDAHAQLGPAERVLSVLLQGLILFFALSGFLLYRPFAESVLNGRPFPNVRQFFANRALRIYPAYLVILVLVAFVFGTAYSAPFTSTMGVDDSAQSVGYLTDPFSIVTNSLMIQTLFPWSIKTGLGPSWSLTVELIFYLILPVVGLLALRLRRRLPPTLAALAPALLVFAIGQLSKLSVVLVYGIDGPKSFYLNWGGNWTAVFMRSFAMQADLFAFGMVTAVLLGVLRRGTVPTRRIELIRWGAVTLGAVAVVTALEFNAGVEIDSAYALAFGALILFVTLPSGSAGAPHWSARVLELLPFRFAGLISYSVYLWHIPVLWYLNRHHLNAGDSVPGFLLNIVLVSIVTGLLATATYYGVEKVALKLKRRTDAPRPEVSVESSLPPRPGLASAE